MFDVVTIQEEFLTLFGYRPDDNPEIAFNPVGDLLTSSSGLFVNAQHALLTIDNLLSVAPPFEEYTYPTWAVGTSYARGYLLKDGAEWFASKQDANIGHATSDTDWWRATNPFNEWLRNKTLDAIALVVTDWINKKFARKTANNLLHRNWMLNYPGNSYQAIGSTERYVNLRVIPNPYIDVLTAIDRVSMHMSGAENITLKLFRNGGAAPLATTVIDVGAQVGLTGTFEVSPGWELKRNEVYYISLDRDSLTTAVPLNSIINMDRNRWGDTYFPGIMPFAEVSAFQHAGPGETGWNDVTSRVTTGNNFGFNIALSARCDYTDFLVDQKGLFPMLLVRGVAMALLRELAFNPNSVINRKESNINRTTLMYEIDGDSQGPRPGGIQAKYQETMKGMTFDSTKFSKFCLPCAGGGMKIGVI